MMLDIFLDFLGYVLFVILGLTVYVSCHTQEEKHRGENLPLMWEENGFLNDFWQWLKKIKKD